MSELDALIRKGQETYIIATINISVETSETLRVAAKRMGVSKKVLMEEIFQEGFETFLIKTKQNKVPI